jgi:hypothetical protein
VKRRSLAVRKMPPAVETAIQDKPFFYALGLKDGTILEFTGAEYLGDTGWVKLESVKAVSGPMSQQKFTLDRGLEVAIEDILWATDAPHGS